MSDHDQPRFEEGRVVANRLELPHSIDTGGWSNLVIPYATVANGDGPTALLIAGNHGDEHEGEIILMELLATIDPAQVRGRLIAIPRLSIEASAADRRLWPDGTNLNRVFPGSPTGTIQQRIAHALSTRFFPRADIVFDLHSGGRSLRFVPMAHMRLVQDRAQRRRMLDAMLAFNTDLHMLYSDVTGVGLLVAEAERQGKVVVSTELGGGGIVTRDSIDVGRRGLRNCLRHLGVLAGTVETRASLGLPPAVIAAALEEDDYVRAPISGTIEPLVEPGDRIAAGALVARLYRPEEPHLPPMAIRAATSGVVCGVRPLAVTRQGDCIAVIGREVTADELVG
ncbi:MAG: succinylglutamate desuccinylase/aspartoacylase family protein [Chloroflexota bacterium]